VRSRIVAWGPPVLVGGAIWQFLAENRRVHVPVDDAYIFYRYAQNLAAGDGLVFNAGERVEGVTSLLWTLLIGAGIMVGIDAVTIGHWLGVASGALLLALTYRYAAFELVDGERFAAALAPWLLLLTKPFAVWATSGLETPLFTAAAVGVLIAEARGRAVLALVLAAVAVLLRPEGVLLGAIVVALFFYKHRTETKTGLLLLAGYGAFLAALTLFRLSYFGAPLPNTFYAKVGGVLPWWGPYYISVFLSQTLLPTLWPSFYARRERYLLGGFCWIAAIFAFVIAVNGDSFSNSRFFLPVVPVSCALVTRGALIGQRRGNRPGQFAVWSVAVSAVWFTFGFVVGVAAAFTAALQAAFGGPPTRRILLAVPSFLLVAGGVVLARKWRPPKDDHGVLSGYSLAARAIGIPSRRYEQREARYQWYFLGETARTTAGVLAARPPEKKLVAALGIGALGYHSKARILDIVGLTDPVVARSRATTEETMDFPGHQRANTRYVLSKKPDYILIPEAGQNFFVLPALVELWDAPEFQRRYIFDPEVNGYRRREY
jgi:arabinofuranosyltransferase